MKEWIAEFRASTREQVLAAANALLMIPGLAERSLVIADIGYESRARVVSAHLRFDPDRFTERSQSRVLFWCARAGAVLRAPHGTPNRQFDVVLAGIAPSDFPAAVDRVCVVAGHEIALSPPLAPFLLLDLGGPAAAGIAYDAARNRLFVPCPVAPPVRDSFVLEVVLPPPARQRVRSFVRVEEVRTREGASPGQPAGFALGIEDESARAAFAAAIPLAGTADSRASARIATAVPVRVGPAPASLATATAGEREAAPAFLRDISHRGAFIRTDHPAPVGSRVRISLQLPDGSPFEAIASVARVTNDGMGVEFRLDAHGESRLAAALAPLAGRPRRVLIVDDDALARAILKEAFESRGFEVLTAPDGQTGLHVLASEILTLDALVTDVCMPGLGGDEFVRRIRGVGGEHDLPIVVATATLDRALADALRSAGADRAVTKSLGAGPIADATLSLISTRSAPLDAPVGISAA